MKLTKNQTVAVILGGLGLVLIVAGIYFFIIKIGPTAQNTASANGNQKTLTEADKLNILNQLKTTSTKSLTASQKQALLKKITPKTAGTIGTLTNQQKLQILQKINNP